MGDEEFRELYVRMSRIVFSFAARRLSADQAREVVSDTFEVLWRKRDQIPTEPDSWPAWVIGVAKFKVLHELQRVSRKHHDNRYVNDYPHLIDQSASDPADTVADTAIGRLVWKNLTSDDQELINLAFIRGLSSPEAARLLGISTTAYTTRLSRARQRIVAMSARLDDDVEQAGRAS